MTAAICVVLGGLCVAVAIIFVAVHLCAKAIRAEIAALPWRPREESPTAPVKPSPQPLKIRLMSGSGLRQLGVMTLPDARLRRPIIRHRTGSELGVFVQSHCAADGVWVYRRAGVEREHA